MLKSGFKIHSLTLTINIYLLITFNNCLNSYWILYLMYFIIIITFTLLILGIIEKIRHQSRLNKIPIRIHINGTRGKSFLTHLICDLFHNAGYCVVAKVTGEQPQIFSSTNGWSMMPRFGPARIKEQMSFLKKIYSAKPQVLIVENMALHAENQYITEALMIKSNVTIITNFRPDNQEIMGINKEDIAKTLSFSFPANGVIIMPETEVIPFILKKVAALKSQLITVNAASKNNNAAITPFTIHFSLLQKISQIYKLNDEVLKKTTIAWQQKIASKNFIIPVSDNLSNKNFINLFTCNDVVSSAELITNLENQNIIQPPYCILLACRADRPLRTIHFLQWILTSLNWQRLILTGTFPKIAVNRLIKQFKNSSDIIYQPQIVPEKIFSQFEKYNSNILGLGNYIKTGEKILSYLHLKDQQ